MKIIPFAPVQSSKDNAWRVRITAQTKGILGQLVEKTGFLKFESEEEASAAFDTLEAGSVKLQFSSEPVNNLYEITVVGITTDVEHA